MGDCSPEKGKEVTPEMIRAGIKALREWIPKDREDQCGWDHLAIRMPSLLTAS